MDGASAACVLVTIARGTADPVAESDGPTCAARRARARDVRSGRRRRLAVRHRRSIRPCRACSAAAIRGGDHVVTPGMGAARGPWPARSLVEAVYAGADAIS